MLLKRYPANPSVAEEAEVAKVSRAPRVERRVDALQCAVPTPKNSRGGVKRGRHVLRCFAPLITGAENLHEATDNLTYVDVPSVGAVFGHRITRSRCAHSA
jgi:hypothetical protein